MNTVKASARDDNSMVGIPPERPTLQLETRGVLQARAKRRTVLRSWKRELFYVVAIIAFVVFLLLHDLLA